MVWDIDLLFAMFKKLNITSGQLKVHARISYVHNSSVVKKSMLRFFFLMKMDHLFFFKLISYPKKLTYLNEDLINHELSYRMSSKDE